MFAARPGFLNLLKDGGRHFSGLEEATYRNIDACKNLCELLCTSFGPNRMNKLIVNQIDKIFVTSDAATILEQLEVQHPAAKLLAMASKMQDQEFGDVTNFVTTFGGELLYQAETLLRQGLSVSDIVKGYQLALNKSLALLEESVCYRVTDLRQLDELKKGVHTAIASKTIPSSETIANLVAEAVLLTLPNNPTYFNIENIRVAKLIGGGLESQSKVIHGMVLTRSVTGSVCHKENCRVMVISCGLELASTETKGTVLLTSGEELLNYTTGEEEKLEEIIKNIGDAGVEAIITGGTISDLAQYFCDKYNILTLKCTSKFELRRLCQTFGIPSLIRLSTPTSEEMGIAESITVEEIASKKVTIIKAKDSKIATILLRGATHSNLNELECSIDDGVHCVKNLIKDNRFLAGGGASEMHLAYSIQEYGKTLLGLEQYAVIKFAEAFECIPRILAENAGLSSLNIITQLYAAQKKKQQTMGVDILMEDNDSSGITDMIEHQDTPVIDHYKAKACALQLAGEAVITILRIDQIIMARPAGGPKPPQQNQHWDQD
ncbi:T-complex protein 1 subunit theta-like isoform X2 [Hylaeus volcanicus]|uniref:T-complex protein 1 subunit theta-like isoform X2 n=1 Tax=Hylaeus volcanicus TaxID=313075 RepID=UPI0023B8795C|nr:T-complex protein 1 subunit theta-like isoform X2 [Hylaeus volcanicus]